MMRVERVLHGHTFWFGLAYLGIVAAVVLGLFVQERLRHVAVKDFSVLFVHNCLASNTTRAGIREFLDDVLVINRATSAPGLAARERLYARYQRTWFFERDCARQLTTLLEQR